MGQNPLQSLNMHHKHQKVILFSKTARNIYQTVLMERIKSFGMVSKQIKKIVDLDT